MRSSGTRKSSAAASAGFAKSCGESAPANSMFLEVRREFGHDCLSDRQRVAVVERRGDVPDRMEDDGLASRIAAAEPALGLGYRKTGGLDEPGRQRVDSGARVD